MIDDKASPRLPPTLLQVFLPILVLVLALTIIVWTFGVDAGGYTPLALILAAVTASLVGVKTGISWGEIEQGIVQTISAGLKAILVLLTVGALIGGWIMAGTVPAIIYYGTQLMAPEWFYPAAALICAITAISVGSSWTVAGALGVGFIGIAQVMGLSPAVTAGAVISGAYLGDKLSPLSDTTNLAAGITGNDLFQHIRHMCWTTIPAFVIALVVFGVVSSQADVHEMGDVLGIMNVALSDQFYLGLPVFLPLLTLFVLSWRKVAVLPSLLAAILMGVVVALIWQRPQILALAGDGDGVLLLKGVALALIDGVSLNSGNEVVDDLLSKGGMSSMLGTVFLIICALAFGGAFETAGLLKRAVEGILRGVKTVGGLIAATLATSFGTNVVCADQYIAIVVPGRMYRESFSQRGLHSLNLSRAIEDSGTLTSVLIPWNTCGLFMAGALGVMTWEYAPWAILNWLSPLISALFGYLSFKVLPLDGVPAQQVQEVPVVPR